MAKTRVGVLFGGRSGEHEVSRVSARAVMAALDRKKYHVTPILITRTGDWRLQGKPLRSVWMTLDRLDVVLPILHGPYGEDGTVQGLLEMVGVPYAGAGVLGSALAMDKEVAKRLFLQAGLPIVPYLSLERRRLESDPAAVAAEVERHLRYPVFVKPANMGSSVGISKVRRRAELAPALELAASYDAKLLVEQGVEARELECGVLGNDEPIASIVGEVVSSNEFYDYRAKYVDNASRLFLPAE
ncbi:MAG: D-alanine--D-alanine ligase family protein, partial [Terriglobales bacterium]